MQPEVLAFFHADSNTFTYVAADAATGAAAVIDPALDYAADSGAVGTRAAQAIVDAIAHRGWQVQWLLETHAHADHLSAAQWLKQHWPQARIGIGDGIRDVQQTLAPRYALPEDFRADGSQFDHLFADDERFALGRLQVRVIAVPGHTSDSIAYLIGDALFPGDSLFMPDAGTARCDFPVAMHGNCLPRSSACTRCRRTRACSSAMTTARAAATWPTRPASANSGAAISMCAMAWRSMRSWRSARHAMPRCPSPG